MKSKMTVLTAVVAGSLWSLAASAQTFSYNPGDLFAGFRNSSGTDLIVDIGSASLYQTYQPGASFTVGGISASALSTALGGNLNGLYWSVFGYQSVGPNTLFTTSARGDITQQTDPTPSAGSSSQGFVVANINGILAGATSSHATSLSSTAATTATSLNQGGQISYTVGIQVPGSTAEEGNFRNDWITVENYTGDTFTGTSVSDLYQNAPGNPLTTTGTYLGNFSLDSSGNFLFNPVPEPSTYAVFGVGILALFALRKFGRKSSI
jgi:PEP-CTERM motif